MQTNTQSEVGHTPGPWIATPANGGEWNITAGAWAIALVMGSAGHEGPNGCSDENARLIAAAPDLLEALKTAKETIRLWHGPVSWDIYDRASPEMKAINAAIAKAVQS